jgi:hypothetical protein
MSEAASARCQALVAETKGTLEWESDGRFGCVVAAFGASDADAVRAAVVLAAEHVWTPENIDSAHKRVQDLASGFGLRPGQILFTSDAADPQMVFAAWWPWGGGQRISVRVGVDGATEADLAGWFGI